MAAAADMAAAAMEWRRPTAVRPAHVTGRQHRRRVLINVAQTRRAASSESCLAKAAKRACLRAARRRNGGNAAADVDDHNHSFEPTGRLSPRWRGRRVLRQEPGLGRIRVATAGIRARACPDLSLFRVSCRPCRRTRFRVSVYKQASHGSARLCLACVRERVIE